MANLQYKGPPTHPRKEGKKCVLWTCGGGWGENQKDKPVSTKKSIFSETIVIESCPSFPE